MITEEMVRIDVDLLDDPAQSELHDAPIVTWGSAPARFPTVHPFAAVGVLVRDENSAAGFEKVFFFREEFVVRDQRFPADALRREIDETSRRGDSRIGCAHKLQAPEKFQAPNSKDRATNHFWCLVFGASLELGCWCLELHFSFRDTCCKTTAKPAAARDISNRRPRSRSGPERDRENGVRRNDRRRKRSARRFPLSFLRRKGAAHPSDHRIRFHALEHLRLVDRPELD